MALPGNIAPLLSPYPGRGLGGSNKPPKGSSGCDRTVSTITFSTLSIARACADVQNDRMANQRQATRLHRAARHCMRDQAMLVFLKEPHC